MFETFVEPQFFPAKSRLWGMIQRADYLAISDCGSPPQTLYSRTTNASPVLHQFGRVITCTAFFPQNSPLRFQVLMAVSMKMTAFWDVVPCRLSDGYKRLRDADCLHYHGYISGRRWRKYSPLKRRFASTRLHGAISQKADCLLHFPLSVGMQWSNEAILEFYPLMCRSLQ
jgi:hypothetical protein